MSEYTSDEYITYGELSTLADDIHGASQYHESEETSYADLLKSVYSSQENFGPSKQTKSKLQTTQSSVKAASNETINANDTDVVIRVNSSELRQMMYIFAGVVAVYILLIAIFTYLCFSYFQPSRNI
jgi:SPX domain protein involved in polyphosphate accumulation